MALSKKESEEMKLQVEKAVEKCVGFHESTLVTTAMNCLISGYDKRKTADKLGSLLESSKALRLSDKIYDVLDNLRNNMQKTPPSKKRHHEPENHNSKKSKFEENGVTPSSKESTKEKQQEKNSKEVKEVLSASQIKEMMAKAQKEIEDRKKQLSAHRSDTRHKGLEPPSASVQRTEEKVKKIAQLQAQIQSKLSTGVLKVPGLNRPDVISKPTPLILDSEGRTVDVTGKEIQLTHVIPTLKANIRAKKREEFRAQLQEKTVEDISESSFFDPRIGTKPIVRNKRALKFNEPGKFQQQADRMRMKAQLEKLQNEISQIARKTGISSATKLAQIAPKIETQVDEIPGVEWWDSVILAGDSYLDDKGNPQLKNSTITNLVEHPIQMKPPAEPSKPIHMHVFLTKKERKKLRRQNRRETWKEEQEKIRLGLEPPPEPKLRISNLMRVLGTEAVQDPTKIEAHVRAQMAKRQKAHEDANASRKLTTEQRRDKKMRKLQEDVSLEVHVAVYRIRELNNPAKKYKVETNANQLFMTGCVVMYKDCNVVVVEGGPKQQSKYKRLMLNRIKWEEDLLKNPTEKDKNNQCVLIWEGVVQQRSFGEMKFKVCATEKLAREQFKKFGVEHYWDLAYSTAVLDNPDAS
ncbi:U4/U6 small nuclear ribonucleoprotein Prp3 isoform X2 [Macrosteles quadrilineatus]|uniref:U4/U6 small nuclear ribonucleoprotein Prp3 isoform X2 n=1 Tax=Macrosteles quadrilineatus TaxID=74068 RepID=UPI0023E23DE3|nr:U4/U6 small nuclear ribonucleoprotein Prp3 isoform X2 [Macrosteles quadrilineatus]